MRIERGFAIGLALVLMLSTALPAAAHHERDSRHLEVRGIIVAMDARTHAFLLREDRTRDRDHMWVVQVLPDTRLRIEGRRQGDDDFERGQLIPLARTLQIGDIVEVEGRLIADGRILAREVKVLSHAQAPPPQVILFPPHTPPPFPPPPPFFGFPGQQFPHQPQILFPQNGAVINTAEFTVIGRTFPFAQVHVDVATVWAFFTFGSGSANVTADGNGFFAATVRPTVRLPGAVYRITVSAQVSGVQMPPTSITVTQQ